MKSIVLLIVAFVGSAAPAAMAESAHFQILETTFQGNCGIVTPVINTLEDNPTINVIIPDFVANTDEGTTYARKLCNIRLRIKADPGYKLGLSEVYYQGKATIDSNNGSGNVSARAFFHGLRGIDAYKFFNAGDRLNFTVDVNEGTPGFSPCGSETFLNLLVDATARSKRDSGEFSEVAIQSGTTTTVPTAIIKCGIEQGQCL